MGPLNQAARSEGRKTMEANLTPSARVRRQLKAGRPRKIINRVIPTLEAVTRIADEADRAERMMQAEGLNPADIHLALIYCTPEKPGFEQIGSYKWLPAPGEIGKFITALEDIAKTTAVLFLGILWYQADPDAQEKGVAWVTQFLAGPEAEKRLFAARDYFVRGGSKTQDN